MAGSQDYEHDPRNDTTLIYVNGALVPRSEAVVSVFDAGFSLGDGVWESFRLHSGRLPFADAHLDRLFRGAATIRIDIGMTREEVADALQETIDANEMSDGVHIRLMVTRGTKRSPTQDPRLTLGPATVVIVPEWKQPRPELATEGLRLFTSSVRCTRPDMFDMRLNSHSRLNLITALLQAIEAGADEALMLDAEGFVSSCNSTNFFFVRDDTVCTSSGTSCFNGVTRGIVVDLCRENGIPLEVGNFALPDVYGAAEAFVTGTFGGVTPVSSIDGREMPTVAGPVTIDVRNLYTQRVEREVERLGLVRAAD
jgi:branched-chain amino acid aminotransferase